MIATDETTILQNPYAGRAQSNLWFGTPADLKQWGGTNGWGGPWMKDEVKAGAASEGFLINGFEKRILHLSHEAATPVNFTIEIDRTGNNKWELYKTMEVPAKGYRYLIFPEALKANWVRVTTNKDCVASAFFHFTGKGYAKSDAMFNSLAGIEEKGTVNANLIRPAAYNKNLQVLDVSHGNKYIEINEKLEYIKPTGDSAASVGKLLALKKDFDMDNASVIIKDKSGTFRLPKTSKAYDQPFAAGWPRGIRELESERFMLNAHGTLYEVGRESGYAAIKPITTHKKKIVDYCTWRGLLVISGTKSGSKTDGHYFGDKENTNGLWFGAIDDLWKLGKPVGEGGVWKDASVNANEASLPFLMTGYDKKKVSLTADKDVTITLEVDVDLNGWHTYKAIHVPAGKTIEHIFPIGYSAHWIRAIADNNCKATVWFKYE